MSQKLALSSCRPGQEDADSRRILAEFHWNIRRFYKSCDVVQQMLVSGVCLKNSGFSFKPWSLLACRAALSCSFLDKLKKAALALDEDMPSWLIFTSDKFSSNLLIQAGICMGSSLETLLLFLKKGIL